MQGKEPERGEAPALCRGRKPESVEAPAFMQGKEPESVEAPGAAFMQGRNRKAWKPPHYAGEGTGKRGTPAFMQGKEPESVEAPAFMRGKERFSAP